MANEKIVVVGGGNAGLSVAAQLLKKRPDLQISIVDPADNHYYQPAWTLVGAGVYNINKTIRKQANCIPAGTIWVKDAVTTFVPDANKIICKSGQAFSYDVLIVCAGIQLNWQAVAGLTETLGKNEVSSNYDFNHAPYTWEMIKNFKGGTAIFTNPVSPIKCGGAPHKIMYLACDYWRKQGILDKCEVHYISGASMLFGVKEYADTLNQVVKQNNIHTHFGCNVTSINGHTKTIEFEEKDANGLLQKKLMQFDLCHAVPPQSAPHFIKQSPLADEQNPYGYVAVDKHTLQHSQYPNIFALGDCTNAPASKTGAAIRKQAPVVVQNLQSFLNGLPLTARYNGYSACPIPTAYGKLMLAEFDYSNTPTMTFPFNQAKPRWSMWLLKTKILPWLYWNKIIKGTA
jgi:sulfide:quinone oxidoreductase